MKLPNLPVEQPQPVQGYGEVEYALQTQGHAGQVLGRAIGDAGAAVEHLALTVRTAQLNVQALQARKTLHALNTNALNTLSQQQTMSEAQLNDFYGGEQNVPKEVRDAIPGGTKVQFQKPDGTVVEEGRPDIPVYAIRHQLYRHLVEPNIKNVAQGIDEPGWRRVFEIGAKLDMEQEVENLARQGTREALAHVNTVVQESINESLMSGDFAGAWTAWKMGGQTMTPAVREVWKHKIEVGESTWVPNEIVAGQDPERIKSLKAGLQNIEANHGVFKVTDSLGQEETVDTSRLTESQRRVFVRASDMALKRIENANQAAIHQRDQSNYYSALGIINHAIATGDINTLRNFPAQLDQSGMAAQFFDQDLPHKLYQIAGQALHNLNPKAKKEPRNDMAVAALMDAAGKASRGQEVDVQNPFTGKPFDFNSPEWQAGGAAAYLINAHAYTPALQQQVNDLINGKKTTPAYIDQAVRDVTKSLVRMDEDDIKSLPKGSKKDEAEAEWGRTSTAIRQDLMEHIQANGGSMTPEQVNRWRQGYLARNPNATFDAPKSYLLGVPMGGGPTQIPPNLEIPGRIRMDMVMNREALHLPDDPEKQRLWYAEFYAPYAKSLVDKYKAKYNGVGPPDEFLLKSAAFIQMNMLKFKSEKKGPSEIAQEAVNAWNPQKR